MTDTAVAYLRDAVLQTLGIACASLIIALVLGTPLAFVIARGGTAARTVSGIATVIRAIPDLVLAIVFVVALGLGPGPAIVALGIHYAAVIAKMFSDVVGAVRREAAETLIATGATPGAALLVGLVPAAWPGIVGFGVYAFESIVRAAVIVGVVGAGGVGALLVQQLNLADYRGFGASIVILAVMVAGIEALGTYFRLRATPRAIGIALVAIAAGGVVALACAPDPPWRMLASAPEHLANYFGSALPQVTPVIARTAAAGALECVLVALAGTLLGAAIAVPLALLIAWPVARGWMRGTGWRPFSLPVELATRVVLTAVRAVPPIAIGLIGVVIIGIGPLAGAFALTVHTAGVLGKLLAESFDVADRAPAEALVANGATGTAATLIALVPAAFGAMLSHVLYRFEWNVRASTALGMVGAGGLGQAIFNAQQLLFTANSAPTCSSRSRWSWPSTHWVAVSVVDSVLNVSPSKDNAERTDPTPYASFPWYDLPEMHAAVDAFWHALAEAFAAAGVRDVPARLDRTRPHGTDTGGACLFTQTCGYPLFTTSRDRFTVLGAPRYGVRGCAGSYHRSFIVVRATSPVREIAALRGSRFAINESDSNSGMNLPRRIFAPLARDGRFFATTVVSGSHAASAALVDAGDADAAAIDVITFALLQRYRPGAVARLRIIGETASTPTPPFVTARASGDAQVAALQAGLAAFFADPAHAPERAALFLDGLDRCDERAYDIVMTYEREAQALGYPALA